VRVTCVTVDCADPKRLATFWSQALGWEARGDSVYPADGIGPSMEFVPVPEDKSGKNRMHIGFETDDLDAEIARLVALGASVAWEEDFPEAWRYRNVVLRDPEGNEFCLGTSRRRHATAVIGDTLRAAESGDFDALHTSLESLRVLASWPT
jgi:predicted enzyme related to lactoylglutathione lyase